MITALTLLLTIFVALGVGVYAGYGMLMALLHLMGHRNEAAAPNAVLVTSQAHSGD